MRTKYQSVGNKHRSAGSKHQRVRTKHRSVGTKHQSVGTKHHSVRIQHQGVNPKSTCERQRTGTRWCSQRGPVHRKQFQCDAIGPTKPVLWHVLACKLPTQGMQMSCPTRHVRHTHRFKGHCTVYFHCGMSRLAFSVTAMCHFHCMLSPSNRTCRRKTIPQTLACTHMSKVVFKKYI